MLNIKSMRRQSNLYGWLLAIPAIFSIAVFIVYPLVYSTWLSFTDYRFLPVEVTWKGLSNYVWLFQKSSFFPGLWLSLQFSLISTVIQTVRGFFLAYALYCMGRRLQGIYKVLLYLPVILPSTVVSVMWQFIYQYEYGLLDRLFALVNLTPPGWLTDPNWKMFSIIFMNTWRFVGMTMVIYFVAMNAVSKDVVEGATIDGAGRMTVLFRIMLPLTWNSTKINVMLSIIGGLKSFDMFYLLFKDDPEMQVVGLYIYKTAFTSKTLCRATAMAVVLSLIIGSLTLVINRVMGREEE